MKNKSTEKVIYDFGDYYNDILPEDAFDDRGERKDKRLVIRLAVLGFFVVLILSACVVLLVLFGGGA